MVGAGTLFKRKGILFTTLACSLAILGIILAENAGLLPRPDFSVRISQWFTYTILILITGGLTYFSNQSIASALARSRAEIQIREHVEMDLRELTQAVEQSPASIMITDLDGNIEYVNPRFTQVTGYGSHEVIGKNPRLLKTELTSPETHREMWDTITSGLEWRGEFVNQKKDGIFFAESVAISPIIDAHGHTQHYLAVKEDITERKQAEAALGQKDLYLLSILQTSKDGFWSMDTHGKIMEANQAFCDMSGYSLDELKQMHITALDPAELPEETKQRMKRIIENGSERFEARQHRKDGSVYDVEVFNMIGKVIYKDAVKAQRGVNKFNFSASNLPEGVYFYKISNGNHTTTKRMIVASK